MVPSLLGPPQIAHPPGDYRRVGARELEFFEVLDLESGGAIAESAVARACLAVDALGPPERQALPTDLDLDTGRVTTRWDS